MSSLALPVEIPQINEAPNLLYILNYTCSLPSLIAGLSVFTLFYRTKKNWTYISRMSFCLTVANLMYTISNLLPLVGIDFDTWIEFVGALGTFSVLSCLYWATRIALVGFQGVLNNSYDPNKSADMKWGFYLPLMVSIIPAIRNNYIKYNNIGLDSDVSSNHPILNILMPTAIYIMPMIISMGLSVYYYIRIIHSLNDVANRLGISMTRFIICPLCLVLVWMPMTICRISFLFGYHSLSLDAIGIIFSRSSGVINALVYGWNYYKVVKTNTEDYQDYLEYDKHASDVDYEYGILDNRL